MARYRCRSILTMAYIIMCPGLDRPRTVGPGLAVEWIKPDPLRGPGDFFAAVFARTSFGSASHEKAPPLRGRASSSSAQDWTRTSTPVKALPPQSSVSTNFTTWALLTAKER